MTYSAQFRKIAVSFPIPQTGTKSYKKSFSIGRLNHETPYCCSLKNQTVTTQESCIRFNFVVIPNYGVLDKFLYVCSPKLLN